MQQALASRLSKPIASRFLEFDPNATAEDYEAAREQQLDQMVDAGEIGPNQRGRVLFMRWMTSEENADRVQLEVDGPVPEPSVPAQVCPAPYVQDGPIPAPVFVAEKIDAPDDERSAKFNRPLDLPDLGII